MAYDKPLPVGTLRAQHGTMLVYGSDHFHLALELYLILDLFYVGIARIVQAYQVGVASTRAHLD